MHVSIVLLMRELTFKQNFKILPIVSDFKGILKELFFIQLYVFVYVMCVQVPIETRKHQIPRAGGTSVCESPDM